MKLKLKKFNILPRRGGLILLLIFAVFFVFLIPRPAWANVGQAIAKIVGNVVLILVDFIVGTLLTWMIGVSPSNPKFPCPLFSGDCGTVRVFSS